MRQLVLVFSLTFSVLFAQNYYPPIANENWDSLPASQLNWPQDRIDSLYRFLDSKNTKSFMVLKNGKRVLEQYFDSYTQDSFWYWASAGKSAAAFLVGMAQDEGLLDIRDKTSDYLGTGWTSLTQAQEDSITIWHQITMTTGLDDGIAATPQVPDPLNCLDPACLQYLTPVGTRWAYHNAPYRLVQDVIAEASGMNINLYTRSRLLQRTGMKGLWANYVLFGRARDMARFGLLVLRNGIWEQDTLIHNSAYMQAMSRPSQNLNQAYGYLWWLNGQNSFLIPRSQILFPGPLTPGAPMDMFAALGKDDQKIYIVPSLDLVVVRQGNASGSLVLGPSSFDSELWEILEWMGATTTSIEPVVESSIHIFPNPVSDYITIQSEKMIAAISCFDIHGRSINIHADPAKRVQLDLSFLEPGYYSLRVEGSSFVEYKKFVKH